MRIQRQLSNTFKRLFESGKAGCRFLILCGLASMSLANSPAGESWLGFWHLYVACLSVEHWVNDALMSVFFLLIGLELERELYNG